jgi:hypothetical protein
MTESLPIEEHITSLEDALESSPTRASTLPSWMHWRKPLGAACTSRMRARYPAGVDVPQL